MLLMFFFYYDVNFIFLLSSFKVREIFFIFFLKEFVEFFIDGAFYCVFCIRRRSFEVEVCFFYRAGVSLVF